mmetsp:Transcript_5081/g.17842  ORF Transcript_5081/g.17842 Transcript_5081/m.17842 type:complete len:286 (+) Transcript_5081:1018-1875(+)
MYFTFPQLIFYVVHNSWFTWSSLGLRLAVEAEVKQRVHRLLVRASPHLEVKVRPGRPARVANAGDHLPRLHRLPLPLGEGLQAVRVPSLDALAVVHFNQVAVSRAVIGAEADHSRCRGQDGASLLGRQVDAAVRGAPPGAERAREHTARQGVCDGDRGGGMLRRGRGLRHRLGGTETNPATQPERLRQPRPREGARPLCNPQSADSQTRNVRPAHPDETVARDDERNPEVLARDDEVRGDLRVRRDQVADRDSEAPGHRVEGVPRPHAVALLGRHRARAKHPRGE